MGKCFAFVRFVSKIEKKARNSEHFYGILTSVISVMKLSQYINKFIKFMLAQMSTLTINAEVLLPTSISYTFGLGLHEYRKNRHFNGSK